MWNQFVDGAGECQWVQDKRGMRFESLRRSRELASNARVWEQMHIVADDFGYEMPGQRQRKGLVNVVVTISDLAIFNFLFTIRRGFWGVTYVADTCLLMIHPGGSHMTPPVSCWLDHITTLRWLPPSTLLWLSTRSSYVYFLIVPPRYISQACWVASSPRLDFFRCTTVLW